jgi:hypothetical protein
MILRSCDSLIGLIIVGIPLACLILLSIGLLIYFAPVIISFVLSVLKYTLWGILIIFVGGAILGGIHGFITSAR